MKIVYFRVLPFINLKYDPEPVKKNLIRLAKHLRILILNFLPFSVFSRPARDGVIKSLHSSLPDFPLSPDVPDVELEALGLHRLDVEALGRRYRRNIFTEIRSFT